MPCAFLDHCEFASTRNMLHFEGCLISWNREGGVAGAERRGITLLEHSHVSPARPSAHGNIKVKALEK
jgi:hypothetical protein